MRVENRPEGEGRGKGGKYTAGSFGGVWDASGNTPDGAPGAKVNHDRIICLLHAGIRQIYKYAHNPV